MFGGMSAEFPREQSMIGQCGPYHEENDSVVAS